MSEAKLYPSGTSDPLEVQTRGSKRVLVHSIHSQVPDTLEELLNPIRLIISLDSHLDIQFGVNRAILPEEVRLAAERTCAHFIFRRMYGNLPAFKGDTEPEEETPTDIVIAIPKMMFETHIEMQRRMIPEALSSPDSIEFYQSFLRRIYDIEIYQSPPRSLIDLVDRTRRAQDWLLDVDVDYMHEMQGECYSPITKGIRLGHLQRAAHVLDFIQRSNPRTITVSEAKVAALRNPRSNISGFLSKLETYGYSVEEVGVFPEDGPIERQIKDCADFFLEVEREVFIRKVQTDPGFNPEELMKEEAPLAREFFTKRGYIIPESS